MDRLGSAGGRGLFDQNDHPVIGAGFSGRFADLKPTQRPAYTLALDWSGALSGFGVSLSLWHQANGWPTLEFWQFYGSMRVYEADLGQYLINIMVYMSWFLLPIWLGGLYRLFRPLNGRNYFFFGILFLVTLAIQYSLHATARMILELFIPLLAAGL